MRCENNMDESRSGNWMLKLDFIFLFFLSPSFALTHTHIVSDWQTEKKRAENFDVVLKWESGCHRCCDHHHHHQPSTATNVVDAVTVPTMISSEMCSVVHFTSFHSILADAKRKWLRFWDGQFFSHSLCPFVCLSVSSAITMHSLSNPKWIPVPSTMRLSFEMNKHQNIYLWFCANLRLPTIYICDTYLLFMPFVGRYVWRRFYTIFFVTFAVAACCSVMPYPLFIRSTRAREFIASSFFFCSACCSVQNHHITHVVYTIFEDFRCGKEWRRRRTLKWFGANVRYKYRGIWYLWPHF